MSPKVADVLERVEGMTGAEKGELVETLLDTVATGQIAREWLDLAVERFAALDRGEGQLHDWNSVLEAGRRRLEELGHVSSPTD